MSASVLRTSQASVGVVREAGSKSVFRPLASAEQRQCRAFSSQTSRVTRQLCFRAMAAKGFGKQVSKPTPVAPTPSKPVPKQQPAQTSQLGFTATPDQLKFGSWTTLLPNTEDFFSKAGKEAKAYTLQTGKIVMLFRHEGVVYCTDVNSTAYQYPLVDAKVTTRPDGIPTVEVPLDGTVYNLASGQVLDWCPDQDGNVIRGLLGTLKKRAEPTPLPVFPTHVTPTGELRIRLTA